MKKLTMAMALMPMMTLAETWNDEATGITWAYRVNDGKAEVCNGWKSPAISSSTTGDITIPTTLGGHLVTSIGECAFEGCGGLTSVTIPEGVTSIGDLAFFYCRGLTSMTIPSSVTNIGRYAFVACSGLTSMTIPSGVKSVGGWAFHGCRGLKSLTIPWNVTILGEGVFDGDLIDKSRATREKENEPKSFCGFKFGDAMCRDCKTDGRIAWDVSELKSSFRYFKRAELWLGVKSGQLYGITMKSECPQRDLDAEFDVVSKIIESKYGIPPDHFTRGSYESKNCDANVFRIGDVNIEVIRFFRDYDSPMNDFTKIAGDEVQDREMLVNTWSPGLAIRVIHTRFKHEVVGEVRKFSTNAGAEAL